MRQIAIVGLGQIGGSLGMALRAHGKRVVGIDRSPEVLETARSRGALDHASLDLAQVSGCEVVVLAVPLDQVVAVAQQVAPLLSADALLTDVTSVKGPIVRALDALRAPVRFVGGHPMFGTEKQGIGQADASLVAGAPFVLTPSGATDPAATDELEGLVREIGMRPLRLSPEEHDHQVAQVSHLPFLVAAALARVTSDTRCAGPTFRDMTRVAASPPQMWRDVLALNRHEVRQAARSLIEELQQLLELEGDALEEALGEACAARERWRRLGGTKL